MTVAKNLSREPQPLRLVIGNTNLDISPEQFERLCLDNPNLILELSEDGQLVMIPPSVIDKDEENFSSENSSISHPTSPTNYDLEELTPEETMRRVAAFERFKERKRQLWDSLTPEQRADHDEQFEMLYKSLEESRN